MYLHVCTRVCLGMCVGMCIHVYGCMSVCTVCVHSVARGEHSNAASEKQTNKSLAKMAPSLSLPAFAQTRMRALRPWGLNKLT